MKRCSLLLKKTLVFVAFLCFLGCNDDDGRARPVGADIHGKWSGVFYQTDSPGSSVSIRASISQDGDAIVMKTDKSTPPGQRFTGTITASASLTLTDASDGETWTSYGTRAQSDYVAISDFVHHPTAEERQPSRNVIELSR